MWQTAKFSSLSQLTWPRRSLYPGPLEVSKLITKFVSRRDLRRQRLSGQCACPAFTASWMMRVWTCSHYVRGFSHHRVEQDYQHAFMKIRHGFKYPRYHWGFFSHCRETWDYPHSVLKTTNQPGVQRNRSKWIKIEFRGAAWAKNRWSHYKNLPAPWRAWANHQFLKNANPLNRPCQKRISIDIMRLLHHECGQNLWESNKLS